MITDQPTPCFEKTQLFDSTFEADHAIARELCLGCPMRTECIAERTKTIELLGIASLEGTWAGNLYTGKKVRARGACGTRAGYNSHRYRDEKACTPCKAAEAEAARLRKAAKQAEEQAAVLEDTDRDTCGTANGYRAHIRNLEEPCTPCRDAEATRARARRAKKKAAAA